MKTTIYGLLGMVKDGKIPERIKYNDYEYRYHDKEHGYCRSGYDCTYICLNSEYYLFDILNNEIEILEEEKKTKPLTKKDIEALGYACGEIRKCFINGWTKSLETKPLEEQKKIPEKLDLILDEQFTNDELQAYIYETQEKVNQVIDYLKSKGE